MKGLIMLSIFLLLAALSSGHAEKHWAFLVAGSNGYENYRHQADVCHSYHVMKNHGIPDERIIVMMYDDIAYNSMNPFPGNIINQSDGPNVYPGVPKDYTGEDVSPDTFLKVLSGDEQGINETLGRKGKVIKSGPNDRIFVYFADHGAAGVLGFPDSMLYCNLLHNTIKFMHENKQFKEMVFYVEACESGSMFDSILESDINVYATTAANDDESSYACYEDPTRQTYLGDVYSVMWMQDSDKENLATETLESQYKLVKEEVNTSHVMQYGDLSVAKRPVGDFQGNLSSTSLKFRPSLKYHPAADAISSRDVEMAILKMRIASASGVELVKHQTELQKLIKRNYQTEEFFRNLVDLTAGKDLFDFFFRLKIPFFPDIDYSCYSEGVEMIRRVCPGMNLIKNDYALGNLKVLANLCKSSIPKEKIWAAIAKLAYESALC